MRTAHISLIDMLIDEIRLSGAPQRALIPLQDVRMMAAPGQSRTNFNDPHQYLEATTKALDAHKRVFDLLGEPGSLAPTPTPSP